MREISADILVLTVGFFTYGIKRRINTKTPSSQRTLK